MTSRIVVVGAGLMGRLIAWQLSRRGAAVRLFDAHGPDAAHSAARAAAAMLAPLAESAISELPIVQMGVHALARWPELLAELPAPVFLQQDGTVILWHRQDAAEAQRFEGLLQRTHRQLPHLPAPQRLDGAGLAALEPSLEGRFAQALYLPQEGQLDNRQLLDALLLALQHSAVELHWHTPIAESDAAGLEARFSEADQIIDCRGLGARPAWNALRGVRGEVIRVHAPEVGLLRPARLIHPRYPLYIAPKPGGVFVIGATEIESEDLSPASVRSTLELLSAAYTVHSGFGEARILEITTQARPALPNNQPRLRRLSDRVLQINGLYRHGYLISPAVLDAALQELEQGGSPFGRQWGLFEV